MDKGANGILEQVFMDQAISGLEKLRSEFETAQHERKNYDDEFFQWTNSKIEEINQLIIQYDHTHVGNNYSPFINIGLESLWEDHTELTKPEVLFCGVLYATRSKLETSEFLLLDPKEYAYTLLSILEKIKLDSVGELMRFMAHYLSIERKMMDKISID